MIDSWTRPPSLFRSLCWRVPGAWMTSHWTRPHRRRHEGWKWLMDSAEGSLEDENFPQRYSEQEFEVKICLKTSWRDHQEKNFKATKPLFLFLEPKWHQSRVKDQSVHTSFRLFYWKSIWDQRKTKMQILKTPSNQVMLTFLTRPSITQSVISTTYRQQTAVDSITGTPQIPKIL